MQLNFENHLNSQINNSNRKNQSKLDFNTQVFTAHINNPDPILSAEKMYGLINDWCLRLDDTI